jgi:CRP/FNR family transcriptional regulator
MPDGRRQVVDFAYPGDVIGLGALGEHGQSAQAMERTIIRAMPLSTLREHAQSDSRLGLKLYEALSRELMAARELLFTVSQRTAAERVAAFLVALSRRNLERGEAATEIVLPMTRMDIADFLGLTIETVSRTLTKLRMEGIIDLEQCILVIIRKPEALAQLAQGGTEGRSRS